MTGFSLSQALLKPLPGPAALVDMTGQIIDGNDAWHLQCHAVGLADSGGKRIDNADVLGGLQDILNPESATREVAVEISGCDGESTHLVRMRICETDATRALVCIDAPDTSATANGLLETLISGSQYVVLVAASNGRVTFANAHFCRLSGYRSEELDKNGQNPFKLEGVDEELRQSLSDAMARGEAVSCRQVLRKAAGEKLHLDLVIQPLRDAGQANAGWFAVGHDVTEEERLRAQYAADATRLQLMLESARMGTWEVDRETGEIVVDDSWLQLARIDPGQRAQAGDIWRSRIHPEDQAKMHERIDGALDGSADVQTSQYRVVLPDGSVVWVQDTSRVIRRDSAGFPTHLIGVVVDITALKDALTSAERSAERLGMAAAAAGLGVWDHDLLAGEFFWSQRMREIHGLEKTIESVSAYAALTHPDDRAKVETEILKGRRTGEPFQLQYRIRRPDEQLRHVEVLAKVHKLDDGTPCRAVGVLRDVTEQVQLALERQNMQKLESVGRLAAGIAHEINTPTQFVSENIRFAKSAVDLLEPVTRCLIESSDRSNLEEALSAIRDDERATYVLTEAPQAIGEALIGMERIADIVRSMKTFSHPGNSRVPVDLNQSISSALNISRSEWSDFAEVRTELDPNLPAVPVVPGEFNQVVLNLIVNAAHAVAERQSDDKELAGRIHVLTRLRGDRVELTVADNGIGMTADVQEKIFDPFFTTKPIGKGTGQGLALTHNFLRSHSGSIEVESRPASGTRFTISLPLECEIRGEESAQ